MIPKKTSSDMFDWDLKRLLKITEQSSGGVLENFKFIEKHLCQSLVFNKVVGL